MAIPSIKRTIQKHTGLKPSQQNDDVVEVMHDPVLNYNGLLGISKTYEMMQDSAPTFYDFLFNNADIIKKAKGLSTPETQSQRVDESEEEEPIDIEGAFNPQYPHLSLMDIKLDMSVHKPTDEQKQLEEHITHLMLPVRGANQKHLYQTSKKFLVSQYNWLLGEQDRIKENFIKYLCLSPEPTKQQLQIATKIYGMLDYDPQGKQGEPIFEAILQLVELRKQQEPKPKLKPGQQELTEEEWAQLREFENDYIYDNSEPPKEPESDDSSTDTLAKWD